MTYKLNDSVTISNGLDELYLINQLQADLYSSHRTNAHLSSSIPHTHNYASPILDTEYDFQSFSNIPTSYSQLYPEIYHKQSNSHIPPPQPPALYDAPQIQEFVERKKYSKRDDESIEEKESISIEFEKISEHCKSLVSFNPFQF